MFFRRLHNLSQKQLYNELDKYGLSLNGAVNKEIMVFEITGDARYFKEACKIFVKLLAPPTFTNEDLKLEVKRICRELEEKDAPITIDYTADKLAWKDTVFEKFATASSMKKISLNKLKEERQKIFTSDNIFFYVTGAVSDENIDCLRELIENYEISALSAPRANIAPVPLNFCSRGPDILIKKSYAYNKILFSFDYDSKNYTHEEIDLLYDMLFEGNNAAFNYTLSEEKGLIYSFDSYIERFNNIGRLCFSYEIDTDELLESIRTSVEVLQNIKKEISDFDFERVKFTYTESDLLQDDADMLNQQMAYDNHLLSYGYKDLSEFKALYKKITKERLIKIANEIFRPENISLAIKAVKKTDENKIREILLSLS
jgi:predicted Zn-dependent peptidase